MKRAAWLAAALLVSVGAAEAGPTPADLVAAASFDYYVLTLSWSPGFCDTGGADKSPEQCGVGSGAGFVVHGLWPNRFDGGDPAGCQMHPDYIPSAALAYGARIYPTRGLAIHEWREHGTCTGLDALHYFRAVQYARDEFAIPDALQHPAQRLRTSPDEILKQFAAVNANLTPASMAVTCERGELIDVRFCLTRDLRAFAHCPAVTQRSCREDALSVSPVP